MKYLKRLGRNAVFWLSATFLPLAAWGGESVPHPDTYLRHANDVCNMKNLTDDPADLMATDPIKDAVPPEIYHLLTFDVEEAKRQTFEIIGFRSPDRVGKIAPEVKNGKYTYKDLEKYPGLKELFPPELLLLIRQQGPPLVASIPEFEIIPTRQFYWHPKQCAATKQNLGKTKLDGNGYIVPFSWHGGLPFPRPSGKFKARQVYYNFDKSYCAFDQCYTSMQEGMAFDRNLTRDKYSQSMGSNILCMGRTLFAPYGWIDDQAKGVGNFRSYSNVTLKPRALRGTVLLNHTYDDPNKTDQWMVYVPQLRRIRKMNASDTQEPSGDITYDDLNHLSQKINSKKYPYKFDIIAEREYLLPIECNTGKVWIDSKNGYSLREVQFMRRPCYVIQMAQLDTDYVYGRRIIYIDRESFRTCFSANYTQQGQLHRSQMQMVIFMADTGQISTYGTPTFQFDHMDLHSTFYMPIAFPAPLERNDFAIEHLLKWGK